MFPWKGRLIAVLSLLLAPSMAGAGSLEAARAKMEEAAQELARADTVEPGRAAQIRAAAQSLIGEAVALYEAAGAPAATDVGLLSEYAQAQQAAFDYDLAAETLQRAVELAPEDGALWHALGASLLKAGPYGREDAFAALRRALELGLEPTRAADAEYQLGRIYYLQHLYGFARDAYVRSVEVNPGHAPAGIALAGLKLRDGAVAEAEADIAALGKAAMAYDADTRVLLREALADFELLQRTFADTAQNHGAYARLLYRAGRFAEAVLAARRATKLAPEDSDTLNFLAAVQLQLGNLPQAVEAYRKSLQANPEQPRVREQMERVQAQVEAAAAQQAPGQSPAPAAGQEN